MSNPKNSYILDLIIDADQITRALHYVITGENGSPFQHAGRLAGTFHFNEGDEVSVRVKAISDKKDNIQIAVTDFTLASISTLAAGNSKRNYLSMFDRDQATVSVSAWGLPSSRDYNEQSGGDKTETTISALHVFKVKAPNGQWRMSGYLSVLIKKESQTNSIPCLYYFDPESSTGTGGDITD